MKRTIPTYLVASGQMKERVTLSKPHQAADLTQPFGIPAPGASTPYTTVWAKIRVLQGRDLYKAQQFVSDVTHTVTIRWRTGISVGDWVNQEGALYRIQAIQNPEEADVRLDLLCLEVNDGTVVA